MIVLIAFCLFSFVTALIECKAYSTIEVEGLHFGDVKEIGFTYSYRGKDNRSVKTDFMIQIVDGKIPSVVDADGILFLTDTQKVLGADRLIIHIIDGKFIMSHQYLPRCSYLMSIVSFLFE
jgi:hypothetical protein